MDQRMPTGEVAEQTYRAIGRFIFEFSQVEYTIRDLLVRSINLDEKHFAPVVESYDVAMLTTVTLEVLKKATDADKVRKIERLINRFRAINDDRKRVVHGLWVPHFDGGMVHYVARNKLTSMRSTNQAQTLDQLADELCKLRSELLQL